MRITLLTTDPLDEACAALVVGCYEDEVTADPILMRVDEALEQKFFGYVRSNGFCGKANSVLVLPSFGRIGPGCLVLVGLGKRGEVTQERLRNAAAVSIQALKYRRVSQPSSILHECYPDRTEGIRAVTEGFILGGYSFDRYKTTGDGDTTVESIQYLFPNGSSESDEKATQEGILVAESTSFARDLVSQPSNVATPAYLANVARQIAEEEGLQCTVLAQNEMHHHQMGGILAVGKGSRQEPQFIVAEYWGAASEDRPVVLVGKGVTFDSGGISLKPREGMERMKDDMAGAAAVFGAMRVIARLALPINVVSLVPAAENLPDGNACKPGDIIRTMNGKTVEIVNTDAEGRLLLCDALHYAQKYKPRLIIDIATLTGACEIALGNIATGIMGNDKGAIDQFKAAGERTGERVWELPLWDEYGDLIKSDIADLKNAGGAKGGSISAGWFLKQFVGDTPWVHLDIAGTAWEDKGRPYVPKGATGVGVRLLAEYLKISCSEMP